MCYVTDSCLKNQCHGIEGLRVTSCVKYVKRKTGEKEQTRKGEMGGGGIIMKKRSGARDRVFLFLLLST